MPKYRVVLYKMEMQMQHVHVVGDDAGHEDDRPVAAVVGRDRYRTSTRSSGLGTILSFIPGFAYVLVLYVAGAMFFHSGRMVIYEFQGHPVTWSGLIVFVGGIVALVEVFRVSQPGVDNSTQVAVILGFAVVQLALIILSIAYPTELWFMRTPENLFLMAMNAVQGYIALRVNARSLVRTIAGAPVTG